MMWSGNLMPYAPLKETGSASNSPGHDLNNIIGPNANLKNAEWPKRYLRRL